MAEYITKEQIIGILYAPRKAILTFEDFEKSIGNLTTADVIERSKIDKAISEIKALAPTPTKIDVEEGNPILNAVYETIYDVLEIIKRNIEGE